MTYYSPRVGQQPFCERKKVEWANRAQARHFTFCLFLTFFRSNDAKPTRHILEHLLNKG